MRKNKNVHSENISPHCALVWLISKHCKNCNHLNYTVLDTVVNKQKTQKQLFDSFEQFQALIFTCRFGVHQDS